MKKILLSILLIVSFYLGHAQVTLNELFVQRGSCTPSAQYFELYNGGGSDISLDCYALVVWYKSGSETGFYVVDFPTGTTIEAGQAWVAAGMTISNTSFCYTNSLSYTPQLNWTNGNVTKKYVRNGSGYNPITTITTQQDIFLNTGTGNGASSFTYNASLFGVIGGTATYINGVFGGMNTGAVNGLTSFPSELSTMPVIPDALNCGGTPYPISFAGLSKNSAEYVTANTGNGNGYYRTNDGQCGSWIKSASPSNHTPGTTTSVGSSSFYFLTRSDFTVCNETEQRDVEITFNYPSGDNPYPLDYWIVRDVNGDLNIDVDPIDDWSDPIEVPSNPGANTVTLTGLFAGETYFVVAKAQQGCFFATLTMPIPNCITLPVKLKSFTASRKQSNVELKWTTTLEQNNSGFELQRQSGAGGWQKIAFVNSKATDGNSVSDLHYSYTDVNDSRGVSQYRLMQIDLDDNAKYSDIRSVQGIGQEARTIISPNPSANGRVNVTFQSASAKRDLQLTDMHGRMLKQWNAYGDNSLQITDLTPGIYQLRIVDRETGTQTVEKIMVVNR